MFGDILRFLLDISFTLFGAVLLLRAWMQLARVHARHPLTHGIGQATNWLVMPLRRVIPGFGGIDWASVVAAWLAALVYVWLLVLLSGFNLMSALPASFLIAVLMVVKWALNLIVWVTLIMVIMSWVNPHAPLMSLLQTLTEPVLGPIRRVLPAPGGFDLSPLVVLVLAQIGLMMVARASFTLFGL
jgi:YggT family protein